VRLALSVVLLTLAACGGPQPDDSQIATSGRDAPAAVRYDQYGSAGSIAPPAEGLANPLSSDPGAIEQGAVLFDAMNCSGCHGGGGVGFTGPSLVDGRWRYGGEDGALFHSIFYGRANGMPAYGGLLSDTSVWQLVAYVQSHPVPGIVPTIAWPQESAR